MDYEDLNGYQIIHTDKNKGSILREKRVVQNMIQQQVADKAGIRLQQYQKFENNEGMKYAKTGRLTSRDVI